MNALTTFLAHIFWPLKGIIYLEVYCLVWIYAMAKAWLGEIGAGILTIVVTIFAILVMMGRTNVFWNASGNAFARIAGGILRLIFALLGAWAFLAWGAINGRIATAREQALPGNMREDNLPLHYRMGRGIYRLLYNGISLIPVVNRNAMVVAVISRILSILIVFWGVWDLKRFLTT